jgi:hypothetical protein
LQGCGDDDSPPDDPRVLDYTIEIAVTTAARFGALQLEITHLGNSGGFIGRGDQIDCVPLVEAIAAANYPGERVAKVGMISLAGISTPAAILRCGFRTRENLNPTAFHIEINDASDTNSKAVEPLPTVVISNVFRR